ncbi:MAG: ABC transporter substrate-binding protein [Tissierellia bacterium]|nr:ABC transporter substrate-binding protein [Tissierellia bacterium]
MKRKILLMASLLAALTSCTSNDKNVEEDKSSNGNLKIGIVQYMDHASLDQAREGFIDYLKDNKIKADFEIENENGDSSLANQVPEKFKDYDLVYAIGTPAAQGAKNVLKDEPIIFSAVTDPVGSGLVKDEKNPDENITGISDYVDSSKQVDDFLKTFPEVKKFGVIYNTGEQNSQVQVENLEKSLDERGLSLKKIGITSTNDIDQALQSIKKDIDCLFLLTDNMVASSAPLVAKVMGEAKIYQLSADEGQVYKGLLLSQGISYYEEGQIAGEMAKEILVDKKEIKDIAVKYHDDTKLIINKDMANTLDIDLNDEAFKDAKIVETQK